MHRIELASSDSVTLLDESKIISDVINTIQETMIKFKVGNNFEVLFSEKEICDTFYVPKVFKDMKFVTYSSEVFKTFVSDFKALVSACEKIEDGDGIKNKILNRRFLLNMLFLADVNTFLAKFSKTVQKSSNLPWEYSNSLDYAMGQLNNMLDHVLTVRKKIGQNCTVDNIMMCLPKDLFPYLKSSAEILSKNTYQGLPLLRDLSFYANKLRGSDSAALTTPISILKQLISFGARYLAAVRDNFNSRFDCSTMRICRKFKLIFDPTPYLYPRSDHLIDDVLCDFPSFERFYQEMPFSDSVSDDFKRTLYFQLRETRKMGFKLVSSFREKNLSMNMNTSQFLKLLYSSLDTDSMAEARYFMSCMIVFPVSETWGSVTDKVIMNKIAFKESDHVDISDITEKIVFIKLVGPSAGANSNRKLFKRALTLMYKGSDYGKHFMAPHGQGFTSVVMEKHLSGSSRNSSFYL